MFKRSGRSYGNATQTIANDPDDWDELDRLDRIEFYPDDRVNFEAIRVVSDRLGSVSIWSSRSSEHFLRRVGRSGRFGRCGRSYGNQALRSIASYNEGKPLQFSNFQRFAATAACNPPDIKCINAFREKAKLYFGTNSENRADYFSRCVNHSIDVEFGRRSFQFAILRSRNFCRHSNLKVQSLAHINPIPLLYKNILARITLVF